MQRKSTIYPSSNQQRLFSMLCITSFMGHDLTIVVVQILFFISAYGIDIDVIHLFVLFKHSCCVHYLNINVICLFIFFKHKCCMSCVVYTRKSCTQLSCLYNTNLRNNKFHTYLKWTHETYKFVMWGYFNFQKIDNFGSFNISK